MREPHALHVEVVADDEALHRDEIPDGELQLLARPANQTLELEERDAGTARLGTSACIEHLEHGQPNQLLDFEIIRGVGAVRDQPPAVP